MTAVLIELPAFANQDALDGLNRQRILSKLINLNPSLIIDAWRDAHQERVVTLADDYLYAPEQNGRGVTTPLREFFLGHTVTSRLAAVGDLLKERPDDQTDSLWDRIRGGLRAARAARRNAHNYHDSYYAR